ncbi:MAG: VWA domain-containing protein, partial [Candidatus Binatia bacterium]
MTTPTLLLAPRRAAVLADFDNTLDVLVRIQAPDMPADATTRRSPIHVALVLDRSGSMSGGPLREARRCAEFVLGGLSPVDRASLTVYDHDVHTLVPLTSATDKARLTDAISRIHSGGTTDLHAGWFAGAETLAPHTSADIVSRVILLSDGCANHGLTDAAAIQAQCAELAAAGVSTSTYGLGRDFNEELMIGMARAGGGNSYYGATAEDLMDPFREELALLNALCARGLVLEFETPEGVRAELLNGYASNRDGGWRLPDLAFSGEAWALIRLTLPRSIARSGANVDLLEVRVRYANLDGAAQPSLQAQLSAPVVAAAAFGAIAEEQLVASRADELAVAGLSEQAREAARNGDWARVDVAIEQVRKLAEANPWLAGTCQALEALAMQRDHATFAKEAAFSSSRMR